MRPSEPLSHVAMFWLLASMGVATALPCLLVPPIETLHDLAAVEAQEMDKVEQLEHRAEQQKRLAEALRKDPQTNLRLVQREMGYQVPGAVRIPRAGAVEDLAPDEDPPSSSAADAVPEWVDLFYPQQWAAAYHAERTRHMILFSSLVLILIAYILYKPRSSPVPAG